MGNPDPSPGYTINLSRTGMFVATATPLKPGRRVRVEILDDRHGFMIEGLVMHAARVSPLLKRLRESGMGLRFLEIDELIAPIVPMSSPTARRRDAEEPAEDLVFADEAEIDETLALLGEEAPHPEGAADSVAPLPEPRESRPELTYPLRFATLPAFLQILKQDIEKGGIFIATTRPAGLHQWITVELRIPAPIDEVVRLPARVVHRVAEGDTKLLAGIGVQLGDTAAAVEKIHRLLYGTREPTD